MVEYYGLLNKNVPEGTWNVIAERHSYSESLQYSNEVILANVEKTSDLRNLIGCIFDLLESGYQYGKDFEFTTLG